MNEETIWQKIKLAKERLEGMRYGANHLSANLSVHFIEKVPGNVFKGLGWVKLKPEIANKLQIPIKYDSHAVPNSEPYCCPINPENKSDWLSPFYQPFYHIPLPKYTGRSKKFTLYIKGENVTLYVQPSLTIEAVRAWLLTWASEDAMLITPGKRIISLQGDLKDTSAFIYFILNSDSDAIKIGMATNVEKRLQSLQTSSPVPLQVLKVVPVKNSKKAKEIEACLHAEFSNLRLSGEWFRAAPLLKDYITRCDESFIKILNKINIVKTFN